MMREAGALAYGRKTYELMVPFWPDMAKSQSGPTQGMKDFAQAFDAVPKIVVFSRTLEKVEDPKTTIIRADLKDEILKLKQEPGGDIFVGGVDIPSQLMKHDLVDEYRIVIMPVIAGDGPRLMGGIPLPETLKLKLVESKVFRAGCIALRYVKP
jgi:dihydrofolate reductase